MEISGVGRLDGIGTRTGCFFPRRCALCSPRVWLAPPRARGEGRKRDTGEESGETGMGKRARFQRRNINGEDSVLRTRRRARLRACACVRSCMHAVHFTWAARGGSRVSEKLAPLCIYVSGFLGRVKGGSKAKLDMGKWGRRWGFHRSRGNTGTGPPTSEPVGPVALVALCFAEEVSSGESAACGARQTEEQASRLLASRGDFLAHRFCFVTWGSVPCVSSNAFWSVPAAEAAFCACFDWQRGRGRFSL